MATLWEEAKFSTFQLKIKSIKARPHKINGKNNFRSSPVILRGFIFFLTTNYESLSVSR